MTPHSIHFLPWLFDPSGQTSICPYWQCYYANTDAIIYVVDSMDRDRIGISKTELLTMTLFYSSGQTSIRPYWRCYYANTDAIIYVVDSMDRDRIGISKTELLTMLEEDELKQAILVVFANKQDLEGEIWRLVNHL